MKNTELCDRDETDPTQVECLGAVNTCTLYLLERCLLWANQDLTDCLAGRAGTHSPHHARTAAAHRQHEITEDCNNLPSNLSPPVGQETSLKFYHGLGQTHHDLEREE